jgi:uncharacterized protein YdeI (YjbR/CyaY-like superfamily)
MNRGTVDDYLRDGCGRCDLYKTPACKALRWAPAVVAIRAVLRAEGLDEALKWGSPCFMAGGRNIVMVGALKDSLTLGFFRGAELPPEAGTLEPSGPNAREGRVLRFRSLDEVPGRLDEVRRCVRLAVALEQAGPRVRPATPPALDLPAELADCLAAVPALRAAFEALTPGRQRSHALHVGGAVQPATRARRAAQCVPIILAGRGFLDR